MLSFTTTTLADALKHMKKMGAASMKLVMRDRHEQPLSALILIEGKEESADAIAAFDKITDAWSDGRPACGIIEWHYVAERLPDDDTAVLMAIEAEDEIREGYRVGSEWFYSDSGAYLEKPTYGGVYAWADLPKPPKKGGA